jgi:type V secretory pathway adhesin AidA
MATYYLTISPINTLSTSTYSIYFDSITPSNLIASGIAQSVLTGVGYSVNDTGRTSVIVKNEDPDCCCDAQIFTFPTPSPTPSPTPNPTPTPTTPSPTPNPTPNPTPTPTTPVPTPNPTPNPTPTPTAGSIIFTVTNPGTFPYPIQAGNGSASGTITNNSGATIYVYSVFNSGGQNNGSIMGDTGFVAGGIALDIPGGPITSAGQTFVSTAYETLPSDNNTVAWSLQKNDGYSTATLMLGYSTTVGGTINLLFP